MRLLPLLALPFLATAAMAPTAPMTAAPAYPASGRATPPPIASPISTRSHSGLRARSRCGSARPGRSARPAQPPPSPTCASCAKTASLEIARRYRRPRDVDREPGAAGPFRRDTAALSGVALGGSGRMSVDQVQGGAFDAVLGGSGSLALGTLRGRTRGTSRSAGRAASPRGLGAQPVGQRRGSGNLQAAGLRASQRGRINRRIGRDPRDGRWPGAASRSWVAARSISDRGARCTVTRIGKAQVRCGV